MTTTGSVKKAGSAIDDARLSAFFDVRQPQAYLALHPTLALGAELGIEINWLPVAIPALRAPSEPGPGDDRGIRHRRFRAQAIAREIAAYAEAQGLVVRDYYREPDPLAIHAGWLWMRSHAGARVGDYLAVVFRDYWAGELDADDIEGAAKRIDGLGEDGARYAGWCRAEGAAGLAALQDELAERGFTAGSPAYWVEGEYFRGGQHLEMIRYVVGGRAGRGPI